MDYIKEAFRNTKIDIEYLKQDISSLSLELNEVKNQIKDLCQILEKLSEKVYNPEKKGIIPIQTDKQDFNSFRQINETDKPYFKPLNDQIMHISTGNEGVSTDKQTNRQTNRQTENPLENAVEILNSLDTIKKEIRLKFKRLTEQEMLVFSALYQLDEEKGFADYRSLSLRINLTESSIRDYIRRLINKGIPIEKKKLNNKNVQLFISNNLKKIATLSTIMELRGI